MEIESKVKETIIKFLGCGLLIGALCFSGLAFAETVILKSGQKIEGKIIERTDKYVKIDLYGIAVTFFLDEVESIDGKPIDVPRAISRTSEKDFSQNIKSGFSDAKAHNTQGLAYYHNSNYDQAISEYDMAIQIDPDFAEAYNNRGIAHGVKGHLDQAISDFNKALQIDPYYSKVYNNRGLMYHMKGNFDQAISDFTKAIEIDPKEVKLYRLRANAYFQKGDYDKYYQDLHMSDLLGYETPPEEMDRLKELIKKEKQRFEGENRTKTMQ